MDKLGVQKQFALSMLQSCDENFHICKILLKGQRLVNLVRSQIIGAGHDVPLPLSFEMTMHSIIHLLRVRRVEGLWSQMVDALIIKN